MVIRRALLAAALVAAFLCAPSAASADRVDTWRTMAAAALARFVAEDDGAQRTNTYAWALEAELRLHGDTAYARTLLDKIWSQRKPDGGWGLPFAWDALSDGTVNPVETTYTVTNTGHVGPPLLLAHQMGMDEVVGPAGTWRIRDALATIVLLTMTTVRIDNADGACIPYSRHINERVAYGCVHNVNAGAAAFLWEANSYGIGRSGLATLVEGVTRREVADYRPTMICPDGSTRTGWWHYMGTPRCNSADHNGYTAESMYLLAPLIGGNVAYRQMVTEHADSPHAPLAHLRLAALPAAPGRVDAVTGLPVWCLLGDQWIPEIQAYLDAATSLERVTQVAQGGARVADNCRPPAGPSPTPTSSTTGSPVPTLSPSVSPSPSPSASSSAEPSPTPSEIG